MEQQHKDILWPVWVLSIVFFVAVVVIAVLDSPKALLLSDENPVYAPPVSTTHTVTVNTMINLNTATKEELVSLPGIGNTLAERILAYREANGSFESVDDLLKISGIGEKLLETLRPFIAV